MEQSLANLQYEDGIPSEQEQHQFNAFNVPRETSNIPHDTNMSASNSGLENNMLMENTQRDENNVSNIVRDIKYSPQYENKMFVPHEEKNMFIPHGENNMFIPPGDNNMFIPHRDNNMFIPPGDNNMFIPHGDNNMFIPPGDNNMFIPHRDNNMFIPEGEQQTNRSYDPNLQRKINPFYPQRREVVSTLPSPHKHATASPLGHLNGRAGKAKNTKNKNIIYAYY